MNNLHTPVLVNEVINYLNINPSGVYVDSTAGMGGHSEKIVNQLTTGKLICIDNDKFAIDILKKKFSNDKRIVIIHSNFSTIKQILSSLNIKNVDGILADLGVSSPMFDDKYRGFSYKFDSKLDMRIDKTQKLDAWFVVNKYSLSKLIDVFKKYGEDNESKKVAIAIVEARKNNDINTTLELVDIIKSAINKRKLHMKKHPARVYFQAIRIEVNNELECLKTFINDGLEKLSLNGILAVISYHSLEDRIVKTLFHKASTNKLPVEIPVINENINFALVNKKPITPSLNEIRSNNRSRSAKLRCIKRISMKGAF
jgi:16S rRNA (cytosine1402-N4)-methyltransferase